MKKTVLCLLLLTGSLPLWRANAQTVTQEQCQQADAQLNQIYQQLRGTLNDVQKQQLKLAQRDWIKKRDAFIAANPGNAQGALYQATMQRVEELKGVIARINQSSGKQTDSPTYAGSTQQTHQVGQTCITKEQCQQADAQLNQVYQKLRGVLNDAQNLQLKQAQTEWIKQRDHVVVWDRTNPQKTVYQITKKRVVALKELILLKKDIDFKKTRKIEAVLQEKIWDEKNYIADCLGKKYRIFTVPGSNKIYIFDVKTKLMYGSVENSIGLEAESDPPSSIALCGSEDYIYSKKQANKGDAYQFNYIPELSYIDGGYTYKSELNGPYTDNLGNICVKVSARGVGTTGIEYKVTKEPNKNFETALNGLHEKDYEYDHEGHMDYRSILFATKHKNLFEKIGFLLWSPDALGYSGINPLRSISNDKLKKCNDGINSENGSLSLKNRFNNSTDDPEQVMKVSFQGNKIVLKTVRRKLLQDLYEKSHDEYAAVQSSSSREVPVSSAEKIDDLLEFRSLEIDVDNLTITSNNSIPNNIIFNPTTVENPRPGYMPEALRSPIRNQISANYSILSDGVKAEVIENNENNKYSIPALFQMAYVYNSHDPLIVGYQISPEKYRSDYRLTIHNLQNNKDIYSSSNNRKDRAFSFMPSHYYNENSGDLWISDNYSIFSIDVSSGAVLKSIDTDKKYEVFAVSEDKIFAMPRMDERRAEILSRSSEKKICDILWDKNGNVMLLGSDGFYARSGKSIREFAARSDGRVYPFEQFDLYLNRPDIVFSDLGAESHKISSLKEAYLRRLKRMGVTEEMLKPDFHLPELQIVGDIPATTAKDQLDLQIKATDDKYPLDRLRVYVNNVPVNGRDGELLRDQKTQSLEKTIPIKLAAGRNKIQVSVLNSAGAESLYANAEVNCTVERSKPKLYAVALGVSQYDRPEWCLKYAAKDATDLIDKLKAKAGSSYSEVKPLLLTDKEVTKESAANIKEFLSGANIDDTVLIFMAGHGLLDDKYDYYFGTTDIDPAKPSERGMPYDAIDTILAEVPSLKKALLMDTCHAGELDDDERKELAASDGKGATVATESSIKGKVAIRAIGTRGMQVKAVEGAKGKSDWYEKLQDMFVDLRRGSGATVISSSQGAEYAFESSEQSNGLFTYALMEALDGKATPNKNGQITISSIGDYVKKRVQDLTKGKQNPNLRGVNLEEDFVLGAAK